MEIAEFGSVVFEVLSISYWGFAGQVMSFRSDNHFVPKSYLKRWADEEGKVWCYRTLVSHEKVPLWRPVSPKGVAYHRHLYTRVIGRQESDEFERWLDAEFEAPAARVVEKVLGEERLVPADYRVLARFLAAQDVRTPTRMLEMLGRARETLPETINRSLKKSVKKLETARRTGTPLPVRERAEAADFPSVVKIERGEERATIKLEVTPGRSYWLYNVKRLLTKTLKVLLKHRWYIVKAPPGMQWITSDDPVVKLNYKGPYDYTFGGGWDYPKSDLFMPLSPLHLLITEVGIRTGQRKNEVLPAEKARFLQRCMIEHADRMVFSSAPDKLVEQVRPRTVEREEFEQDKQAWRRWHEEQKASEERIFKAKNGD